MYDPSKTSKLKGVLHWVAELATGVEPLEVEIRLFEKLFLQVYEQILGWWLFSPPSRSARCTKCPKELCSSIAFRRHTRVHR